MSTKPFYGGNMVRVFEARLVRRPCKLKDIINNLISLVCSDVVGSLNNQKQYCILRIRVLVAPGIIF